MFQMSQFILRLHQNLLVLLGEAIRCLLCILAMHRIEVEFNAVVIIVCVSLFFALINFLGWWIRLIRSSKVLALALGWAGISLWPSSLLPFLWQNMTCWALSCLLLNFAIVPVIVLSLGSYRPIIWIVLNSLTDIIWPSTFFGAGLQLLLDDVLDMRLSLLWNLLVILSVHRIMIQLRDNLALVPLRNWILNLWRILANRTGLLR